MNPVCPACRTPTDLVRWDDIAGFGCPSCGGHCIRADALQDFLLKYSKTQTFSRIMEAARDSASSQRALKCPDCTSDTYRVMRIGLVELDVCSTCVGMYFDKHEATLYLRQTRARKFPGNVANQTFMSIDGLGTLLEFIGNLFH
ncbi:MAG: zf-TFIIB domain-containing protein [Pseudomonadota bacterium]